MSLEGGDGEEGEGGGEEGGGEISPMCDCIGHWPLWDRCPKGDRIIWKIMHGYLGETLGGKFCEAPTHFTFGAKYDYHINQ